MNLQTIIPLKPRQSNQIDYNSKVVLLGSCFSENIGDKFGYFKLQQFQNPFGLLFHPLAIERLIANVVNQKEYTTTDIFFHNEQWHCFDAHSKLSHTSEAELLQNLNNNASQTFQFLKQATHIIITLGTAWVYRLKESNSFVANCHKVPQKNFSKELLSVEAIKQSLQNSIKLIERINPDVQFIFTVSPVRHIKDGFVENMRSKAHLVTAIHEFLNQKSSIENRQSLYFPSLEIMMDELRDYRFYNEDLLHPNRTAINYIWEKFKLVWITEEAQNVMNAVEIIQKGLAHRPFNANSEAHSNFKINLQKKINTLVNRYQHITFD